MNEVAHEAAREDHKHELEVTDDERGEVKQEQQRDGGFAGAQEVKQKERREAENMQLGRDQEGKSGDDR
jgi:predicted Rdx family selenoprotein